MNISLDVINGIISGIVTVAGLFGLHKAGLIDWLKKEAPVIVEVANEIIHTPGAKIVETELHHKVDELTKKFQSSELGRLVAEALNYTEKDWEQLSDDQKKALILHISTLLPNEWHFTKAQIEEAFVLAQKASDIVGKLPIIQSADQFTSEQIALKPELQTVEK